MRDFKGIWIPSDIWLDERLNALEKAILMEIDSLDVDGCYASNEYLADFCKCSERKITEAISKLIELGYISLKSFDGRTRILISNLAKNSILPRKNCEAASQKMKANNNNRDNIDENKENISKDKKEKFGSYGRVKLSQTEYKKLVDDYGKKYIDDLIMKLDEYVESNNNKNKYTNFNLVIRKAIRENWFNDKDVSGKKIVYKSEWGKQFRESFKKEKEDQEESSGSAWLDDFKKRFK